MAWHRAHDESTQGQRGSTLELPTAAKTRMEQRKTTQPNKTVVDHGGALHAGALCARRCMKRMERQLDRSYCLIGLAPFLMANTLRGAAAEPL